METYTREIAGIRKVIAAFVDTGSIDVGKLKVMNRIIRMTREGQVKVLNMPTLSLEQQRILFSAIRSINTVIEVMKQRLKTALEREENPTTAELSLEIMVSVSNLGNYIDRFLKNRELKINKMFEFSRILLKKAKKYGFFKDIKTQLDEIGITSEDVKTFVERLNKNIESEIDTAMEEGAINENSDRDLSFG